MAHQIRAETPTSATFPHHHAHTDSLVSVPLTDSVLASPLEASPRFGGQDDDDDEVGLHYKYQES